MKKVLSILIIAILLFSSAKTQSIRSVNLQSGWKHKLGDNLDWKSPSFDDNQWLSIVPYDYWDYLHEKDYDEYGWYRIKFFLPNKIKEGLSDSDSIYFYLGRIDDNDETYLNGVVIGQNTKNVSPETAGEWANKQFFYDKERNYGLPLNSNLLKWNEVNTLAIRVYDIWMKGGMATPQPRIYVNSTWEGKIEVEEKTKHPALFNIGEYSEVVYVVENKNQKQELNAKLIIDIYPGKATQPSFTDVQDINVAPGSTSEVKYSFPALVEDFYHVAYKIIENSTGYSFGHKEFYGLARKDIKLQDEPVKPVVEDKIKTLYNPLVPRHTHFDGYLGEKMDVNAKKGLSFFPQQFVDPYFVDDEPIWPVGEIAKVVHGGMKRLQYEKDEKLFEVMQTIVLTWIGAQESDGYLGTYKPHNKWIVWDAWDHKYVMLGLVQFYAVTGYQPALNAAKKIGDLMCKTFGEKEGQLDIVANGPNMGMASGSIFEPMVYLYKYTGEEKYLDFCNYILRAYEQENGPKIVSELTQGSGSVFKVGNGKGYEMLSCIIGLVQMYKLTGEENLINAAANAWEDIVSKRLYITGTATEFEHFQEDYQLGAGKEHSMGEGCVTSHWMYLSKELFKIKGDQKYLDEIDKSLYNHLLAAQHPVTGDIVYYTALQDAKYYLPFDLNIGPPPCCHLSVKRCIAEIPEFAFYQKENEIGINLYNPSEFSTTVLKSNDKKVNVGFSVNSTYPFDNNIEITINPENTVQFSLSLRVPAWSENFKAKIGGKTFSGKPGEYLKIERKWKKGDKINVSMDFPVVVLEGGKSYPNHYAIKYGTQVLAVDSEVNNIKDLAEVFFDGSVEVKLKPYKGKLPEKWVGQQSFVTGSVKTKDGKEVILVPFSDSSQTGGDIRVWIKSKDK